MARGIEDIATMYKYNIILNNSDQNKERELQLINTMYEKQVDGILFMSDTISDEHLEQFKGESVPVVLATTYDENDKLPSVNIDYEKAGYEATKYLIDQGNERIAFVSENEEAIINQLKYKGYIRALKEAFLPINDDYIIHGQYTHDSGMKAAEQLLKLDDRPTAVFTASDELGMGVIHGAQDFGLKVPEDLEVFGFNNTRLSTMVRPTLTAIDQPTYDIGAVAMRLLTKLMNKEEVEESTVILPHRIVKRNSTK